MMCYLHDKSYLKGDLICTILNEMRRTCYNLFERQYKQVRKFLFPCISSHITDIVSIY